MRIGWTKSYIRSVVQLQSRISVSVSISSLAEGCGRGDGARGRCAGAADERAGYDAHGSLLSLLSIGWLSARLRSSPLHSFGRSTTRHEPGRRTRIWCVRSSSRSSLSLSLSSISRFFFQRFARLLGAFSPASFSAALTDLLPSSQLWPSLASRHCTLWQRRFSPTLLCASYLDRRPSLEWFSRRICLSTPLYSSTCVLDTCTRPGFITWSLL